jgi:hypothetical protein
MLEILGGLAIGAVSGCSAALVGYFKNYKPDTGFEEFDHLKLIQTALIGATVGGLAGYFGITYDSALSFASSVGLVVVIENAGKALYRWLRPKFKR